MVEDVYGSALCQNRHVINLGSGQYTIQLHLKLGWAWSLQVLRLACSIHVEIDWNSTDSWAQLVQLWFSLSKLTDKYNLGYSQGNKSSWYGSVWLLCENSVALLCLTLYFRVPVNSSDVSPLWDISFITICRFRSLLKCETQSTWKSGPFFFYLWVIASELCIIFNVQYSTCTILHFPIIW